MTLRRRYYTAVTFPWAGLYLQMVMVYDAVSAPTEQKMHCRLLFSQDLQAWHPVEPTQDFLPLGAPRAFDSHIIFAASGVHRFGGQERVYYMGGNGPHYGVRNSSFALTTFRADGFAGVGRAAVAAGAADAAHGASTLEVVSTTIKAGGGTVTVTADVAQGDTLVVVRRCLARNCAATTKALSGAMTGAPLNFTGGGGAFIVGESVVLTFTLSAGDHDSLLYTIGWD
eukprot:COSAG01_NODE_3839_length_5646_cov_8.715934_4_plen_227_part_00